MKHVICERCGREWYVRGERVAWSTKVKIHRALMVCACGCDNSKAAKRERMAEAGKP